MLPFRKILCPIDYSEPCRAVVPYVKEMSHRFGAELILVHAYGPSAITAHGYGESSMTDPNLCGEVRADQAERLRTFALEMFPSQHVEAIVDLGEPGCVIHKVARHQGADLVMLATRGHGPVRRFLLGSVTAKVLHDMSTPVWTGAGSTLEQHSCKQPYESILCALDRSDEAEVVLKAAMTFADEYRARLSIVHVVETPVWAEFDFDHVKQKLIEAAHVWLRELVNQLDCELPFTVRDSVLPDAVCQEVIRTKADLLVTGRGHAQNSFARSWSKLYPIIQESPCPVLSI